jgi:hypothetical protein
MPLAAWPGCFNPEQRLPEALVADFLFRVSLLFLWNIGKAAHPGGSAYGRSKQDRNCAGFRTLEAV